LSKQFLHKKYLIQPKYNQEVISWLTRGIFIRKISRFQHFGANSRSILRIQFGSNHEIDKI
jgi:hypothetical protein